MTDRTFRFGVVGGQTGSAREWTAFARRVEDAGFATLLCPDAFTVAAPFGALSAAAAVTTTLRLGTFVLATPLHPAASIAWDAASLDRLSDGRLELGLGAGRPTAAAEAELLGVPFGTPGERIAQLERTIRDVRGLLATAAGNAGAGGDQAMGPDSGLVPAQRPGPPILIAGRGPKILRLAATEADIVSIAVSDEPSLADRVEWLRDYAGDRFDQLELNINIFALGDEIAPWMTRMFNVDPRVARDNQDIRVLNGDLSTIVDTLRRRRDTYGISYVLVNSFAMEKMAPVVERLAGT
ncbi:MAG TPA: TIGR03621 family F420-dependent LLM class oxidoreductase [Pseudonocardiaceae bacterium]|nr:TIGR03621 family F420-dependent LLM class oxidoreductase [Pseudonocardiaceae bacterium]